jgi:hypothetical protein
MLLLLSVSSHVSDKEWGAVCNMQGKGGLNDDTIGEWMGSKDLHTGAETTEDKVCKFPCCVVYTHPYIC